MTEQAQEAPSVTALLNDLVGRAERQADNQGGERTISLRELLDSLDERAFGLGILVLALPCAVPFLYGIPQIVALPMLALAGQLALGREQLWLPNKLASRRIAVSGLDKVVLRAGPALRLLERFSAARLPFLSEGIGLRIIGALLLIPIASIMTPFPLTNTTPGIGVGIAAVGLLERDGLLILLGLLLGLFWVFLLVVFGVEAVSAFKQLLLDQFSR